MKCCKNAVVKTRVLNGRGQERNTNAGAIKNGLFLCETQSPNTNAFHIHTQTRLGETLAVVASTFGVNLRNYRHFRLKSGWARVTPCRPPPFPAVLMFLRIMQSERRKTCWKLLYSIYSYSITIHKTRTHKHKKHRAHESNVGPRRCSIHFGELFQHAYTFTIC